MAMDTLRDAFVEELRDALSAEKQLTKALPKMAKAASNAQLKQAFEHHLEETEQHVKRVEQAIESLDLKPRAKKCKAMEGLIEEGSEIISEKAEESVHDAMLIAAAQKVEHYEIATYGTLCAWGEILGYKEPVKLLKQNLDQEKQADEKLKELAKEVNTAATSA